MNDTEKLGIDWSILPGFRVRPLNNIIPKAIQAETLLGWRNLSKGGSAIWYGLLLACRTRILLLAITEYGLL